jgi:hypothetical protein
MRHDNEDPQEDEVGSGELAHGVSSSGVLVLVVVQTRYIDWKCFLIRSESGSSPVKRWNA